MIIKVLGSAAGGGFPQWNCNCHNCVAVRSGAPGFKVRTQSSLAISRDGSSWALLNASPDLRQQIERTPGLHADKKQGLRHSPIKAVVLTNGDVDHINAPTVRGVSASWPKVCWLSVMAVVSSDNQ
jgi:pyrroloquinoline quinone biosynthesis protein B